jgi:Zn-finger protein
MKPIKFKEANKILSKPESWGEEKECGLLPVFTDGEQCISCWKLSFIQRINALFFGKVWLSTYTGKTQPPVWLDCKKTVFEKPEKQ